MLPETTPDSSSVLSPRSSQAVIGWLAIYLGREYRFLIRGLSLEAGGVQPRGEESSEVLVEDSSPSHDNSRGLPINNPSALRRSEQNLSKLAFETLISGLICSVGDSHGNKSIETGFGIDMARALRLFAITGNIREFKGSLSSFCGRIWCGM